MVAIIINGYAWDVEISSAIYESETRFEMTFRVSVIYWQGMVSYSPGQTTVTTLSWFII